MSAIKRSPSPSTLSNETAPKQPKMSSTTTTPTPLPASAGLQVKRLGDKASLPTRGSPLAAGYDLYAAESKTIPAHGKALIDTQLSIAVPAGTYGRVAPRSGLASKHSIHTGAGVIDADYRGCVFVLLFNLGEVDFQVNQGDRVAQLILERIYTPEVIEVAELDSTDRGAGGFGSTGGFGQVVGEAVQGVQGVVGRVVEGVQEVGQALGQSAGSAVDVVKQAGEEAK